MKTYWDEIFSLDQKIKHGDAKIVVDFVNYLKDKGLLTITLSELAKIAATETNKPSAVWNTLHEFAKEQFE